MMRTYSAKPTDIERKWYLIDATGATLGRMSTTIAKLLTGKNKPIFTQHIDCGDYVVVINASKLKVTGKKLDQKIYYSHSGFPGGLHEKTLSQKMSEDPASVLIHSVRGMLPVNKLRDERLQRFKVYNNDQHKHEGQQPTPLKLEGQK